MDYKGSNNISHPHTSSERAPSSLSPYAPPLEAKSLHAPELKPLQV